MYAEVLVPGPGGKPLFHVAPNFGVVPGRVLFDGNEPNGYFEDNDAVWHHLLRHPPVGRKEGSCLRGAVFGETAQAATQLNVEYLDGLVLDADEFPDGRAYTYDDIVRRLFGHRFIIWTTYNSTPERPRYRIVLPLARPVPRRQFRALWEYVNNDLGNVIGHKQFNADRLGYLPRVNSEAHRPYYAYAINQGPLFDAYNRYGELPETPDRVALDYVADDILIDRTEWVSDEEAMAKARSYMRQAHMGVQPGARHHKLLEKACQLWWDFYLNEEQVRTILLEINSRFSQPKQPVDVLKEVEAGYVWTRGPHARRQTVQAGSRRSRPPPTTMSHLKEAAKRLRRRQHDLAGALAAVAAGEACVSAANEIVPVLRGLARLLGELFVDGDPQQLASLLHDGQAPILQAYNVSLPPASQLAQIVFGRQEESKNGNKHRRDVEDQILAATIAEATGNKRSAPYTLEEFSDYARAFGETHETLKRRLIINFGPSFFFFVEGRYSPAVEHNVDVAARQYLSLAKPFGIELHKPTASESVRPKTTAELLEDYGSMAHSANYSFCAKQSRYDAPTRTFIYAQTPLRPLEPFRVAEIDDYLSIVGSEDFLDWLAHLPNLERPARLIYFWGPRNCGKSFVPKCMSRLWSETGPSGGDALFGSFNEGIGRNPLVHMDEALPEEFRGSRGTELLRKEIAETQRPMTAKFKKDSQMLGALRFVFSANDPGHITTSATLTKDDADAIVDRLLTIHLNPQARDYLTNTLGYERVSRWQTDDLFARHVLWLRENRPLANMDRFGPIPRNNAVNQTAQHSLRFSGAASDVMEFIYRAVARGAPVVDSIQVGTGDAGLQLLACRDEMVESWPFSDGAGNAKAPHPRDLTKAMAALSSRTVRAWSVQKNTDRMCQVIDLSLVYAWIELRQLDRVTFDRRLAEKVPLATRYVAAQAQAA